MHSALSGDCVSAAPTAAAMNGAVQGVATSVVNTPVKNDALIAVALRQSIADAGEAAAHFEHARQIQAHGEQQVNHQSDEQRRLQLETPADLLAAGTQRQQHGGQARASR